jgi:hypothetical protein
VVFLIIRNSLSADGNNMVNLVILLPPLVQGRPETTAGADNDYG